MAHSYRIHLPVRTANLAIGLMLLIFGLPGCGAPAEEQREALGIQEAEVQMLLWCGEARGALYELNRMSIGQQRIDAGILDHAETSLRQLAMEANASEDIKQDVEAWHRAIVAHSQSLGSFQPTIANGHFVEPDTTEIDRTLLDAVTPAAQRLAAWVGQVCGDP